MGPVVFQPWQHLRHFPHIRVIRAALPDGTVARTDGHSTIWLDHDLLQCEERCALTHELVHIERGHRREQPAAVEYAVREETARRLISFEWLVDAMQWSLCPNELADELCVTPEVVRDRIETLTTKEKAYIRDREGWYGAESA